MLEKGKHPGERFSKQLHTQSLRANTYHVQQKGECNEQIGFAGLSSALRTETSVFMWSLLTSNSMRGLWAGPIGDYKHKPKDKP